MSAAFLLLFSAMLVSAPDKGLDLPVTKDPPGTFQTATSSTVPLPPPPDDPRDEPPPVFFGEEIESANNTLVYVIDTSSSMDGRTGSDRLNKAKRECERSISALVPAIRFNCVSYSCDMRRLWGQVRSATPGAKSEARVWVGQLHGHDATGTGPAVSLALSDRQVMAVVLLTDGAPNCGANGIEGHRAMIRNHNTQGAVINVFGIEAVGEWRGFCQSVAADSGGSYVDVP